MSFSPRILTCSMNSRVCSTNGPCYLGSLVLLIQGLLCLEWGDLSRWYCTDLKLFYDEPCFQNWSYQKHFTECSNFALPFILFFFPDIARYLDIHHVQINSKRNLLSERIQTSYIIETDGGQRPAWAKNSWADGGGGGGKSSPLPSWLLPAPARVCVSSAKLQQ